MAATVPPVAQVYFGKPMLPDVSRVLACLYEKEITFELVDMYEGHRMPADILKLQATMRAPVPAFKDRDAFLLESRAICRYVSETYAEHGNKYLLGRDLLDRGSIEQWLKTEEQSFNPPSWALVFHLAFAPLTNGNELDQSLVTESEKKLGGVLDVYEHRLRESKYLAGDEFTLADLSHLPNTHYLVNSRQWNHLFNSRKNIQRWWENISNRPSWTKVVKMLNEVETPKKSSAAEEVATAREAKISHLSQTPTAATGSQTSPKSTPVVKTSPQTAATDTQTSPPQSTPVVPQSTPVVKTSPQTAATDSQTSPQSTPFVPQSTPEIKTGPQTAATASQTSLGTAAPEPSSKPSLEQTSPKSTPVVKTSPQTAATDTQTSPPQSTPVVPQSTPVVKTSPQTAATDSQTSPQSTPVVPQSTPEIKTGPQTAATASQTSLGTAAPEPSSKPSLEQKSSKSSADKPDSAIDQQSSPKGPTTNLVSRSEPATQPTPQSQQGDSSTGKPTSVTTRSNQKTDTPMDNSAPTGTSETKATSQPDSTASSTASDKPNSQPSGDKPAS